MTELPLANQINFFISYATAFLVFALIDTRACPLYPRKRTYAAHKLMSALGHKRTCAVQTTVSALGQKRTSIQIRPRCLSMMTQI